MITCAVDMSDRLKQRPRTTSGRTNNLVYTSLVTNDPWRGSEIAWGHNSPRSNSSLGVTGSRYNGGKQHTIEIGPNSGGFLPVLNAKKRAETARPSSKANGRGRLTASQVINTKLLKSADHPPNEPTSSLKANLTGSVAMFDLSAIVPSLTNLSNKPTLKADPVNQTPSYPSKLQYTKVSLDLSSSRELKMLDSNNNRLPSPTIDATKLIRNSLLGMTAIDQNSNLLNTRHDTPHLVPNRLQYSVEHGDETKSHRLNNTLATRLITSPTNEATSASDITNPRQNQAESSDLTDNDAQLKPILKQNPDNEIKRPVLPQRNFSIPIAPPDVINTRGSPKRGAVNKRRVTRRAHDTVLEQKPTANSLDASSSIEDSLDEEQNFSNAVTGEKSGSKSVRFHEEITQVKEYIPWEAPNNCMVEQQPSAFSWSQFHEPFSSLDSPKKSSLTHMFR